jgi:hypothetical protein
MLENLESSRGAAERVVPLQDLENRLERILHVNGEGGLNVLRDRAREIRDTLGWSKEFERLDGIIGNLLGTRTGKLPSPVALARAAGEPFDVPCVERLQLLFAELRGRPLPDIHDAFTSPEHITNKAFFEAYFSNYIEGTTFEIEEAEEIVFNKRIPAARPVDAHDILGTYRLVSDPTEMRRTPGTFDGLLELLRSRHVMLMQQRPAAMPGQFKKLPNRAGDSHFVHPDYVLGTLRRGHELYASLAPGIARAIYTMFLVTDVHPFVDGNGRIARVMMNSELVAAGQPTIIVPNAFREDYVGTLRSLTRRHRPAPLVDALLKAQRFSNLEFSAYAAILVELQRKNWFRDDDQARVVE